MKSRIRTVVVSFVVLAAATMGGCIVVHDSCRDLEPIDLGTYQPGPYEGAIRAASSVGFSDQRNDTLATIAAKPDLTEMDQLSILRVLSSKRGFSHDTTRVLETLCRNPATTPRTKAAIGSNLGKMVGFSDDRKRIADLLAQSPAASQ